MKLTDLQFNLTQTDIIINWYCEIQNEVKEKIISLGDLEQWVREKELHIYYDPNSETITKERIEPIQYIREHLDKWDIETFLKETQTNILYTKKGNYERVRK